MNNSTHFLNFFASHVYETHNKKYKKLDNQNSKNMLKNMQSSEPKKRGRKKKVPVTIDAPKTNEEPTSEYAYSTNVDNANTFKCTDEDFSNIPDDHMEKTVSYEPALATECHRNLPSVFIKQADNTSPVEWPMTSNLRCINCTRKIPGIPWLIPIGKSRGMYVMSNDGMGCRYECALRRIIEINDFHCTTQASYLADIAIRYFGMNRSKLKAGNPRTMLDCFSGTGITIDAYHENMTHPEMSVNIRLPPFIPSTMVFEKKHPNESRWKVQGLRVPDKKERDRIYREERVVGPQPYPGQVSMYEKVFASYYPKAITTKANAAQADKSSGSSKGKGVKRDRKCEDDVDIVADNRETNNESTQYTEPKEILDNNITDGSNSEKIHTNAKKCKLKLNTPAHKNSMEFLFKKKNKK